MGIVPYQRDDALLTALKSIVLQDTNGMSRDPISASGKTKMLFCGSFDIHLRDRRAQSKGDVFLHI